MIKNIVKKIGFTAAALALAAGLASAPSASAASFSASSTTPIVQEQVGKLYVYVAFGGPATTQQATVSVYNEDGVVAQALTPANQEVAFKLNEGVYRVTVSAKGYGTVTQEVKVAANMGTSVKVQLSPSTSLIGPWLSR